MSSTRTLIPVYNGREDPLRVNNRLVGFGFRCALTALRATRPETAIAAAAALEETLTTHELPCEARSGFLSWSLAVEACAVRPVTVLPVSALGFCRDECLAISLVAACQHDACPALRACACALLGCDHCPRVLDATNHVALMLKRFDKMLDAIEPSGPGGRGRSGSHTAPSSTKVH